MYNAERDMEALRPWQRRLHAIIFEAETPLGRMFDILLLAGILLSMLAIMLESVQSLQQEYGLFFRVVEWIFTILFTIEYVLRLLCVARPLRYATSFFGIVDLVSIIPTYISLYVTGTQSLLMIRALRLLRTFRVLKLTRYLGEANVLMTALRNSRAKITVFLGAVLTLVSITGTIMYLVEGEESGFTSIPKAMYWAIVTMTTVGYGDITPQTSFGQGLAAIVMILGYGIIAVPTGIVTSELSMVTRSRDKAHTRICDNCQLEGHDFTANYCRKCGFLLHERPSQG